MCALNAMTIKPEQAVYTLVVGLGKTGLSVVRYLHALGESIVVVDSRDIPPGLAALKQDFSDVKYHTGKFDKKIFVNAHRIIVSPGVSLAEPALLEARNNNIEIIGDIDLFAHEAQAPVVGITGSNGKSTVTTLMAAMAADAGLKAVACGNIGVPVLDALNDDVDLYVIELSSFQLETLQYLPMKASVVLNISADHLDRYENISAYASSKQAIYSHAETLVVNKDDALAGSVVDADKARISFTLDVPGRGEFGLRHDSSGETSLYHGERYLISARQVRLKGVHNIQNVLAALALGYAIGLPLESMMETLKTFKGLPHRTQLVADIDGVSWINDSKATNVGAAIAALVGLAGKHIWIAGGEAKEADFSELTEVVRKHCRAVVLIGKDTDLIKAVLPQDIAVAYAADMASAVSAAQSLAKPGDNVLLAPACASFDMFDNFEHRGEVFIREVEKLRSGVVS